MNKKQYTLNTLLAAILGAVLFVAVILRTFFPRIILPHLDASNMVLISLVALLADRYLAPGAKRCWICLPVFAALTFGLLPFAACFVGITDALWLALKGCVVFSALTWVFDSAMDRLSSGPVAKAAPVLTALGLYLAAQCLMGMF